jgi:hypothetical protein
MTLKEIEKRVDIIVYHYKSMSVAYGKACAFVGMSHESPIFRASWNAFRSMLDMIDVQGWISWHIYTNDCGAKAMKAGFDGNLTKIKTNRQLARLIMESLKRNN